MPHSYNKIWVHVIFATKDREPLIAQEKESLVYNHIKEQLREMGCPVRIVNGMPDHIHLLFLLNPQKSISEVIKHVKGNTSHWINAQDFADGKFAWQSGYASYSVSESQLEKVYNYILGQKQQHQRVSFMEEYEAFIKRHGLNE